jgi:hypothetical protein
VRGEGQEDLIVGEVALEGRTGEDKGKGGKKSGQRRKEGRKGGSKASACSHQAGKVLSLDTSNVCLQTTSLKNTHWVIAIVGKSTPFTTFFT